MPALCCETQERVLDTLKARTLELANSEAPSGKTAIVRDLQPEDFGMANNVWQLDMSGGTFSANAWNTYATFTVPDNTYVGVGSIFDLTPTPVVTGVKLKAGASYVRKWHMEQYHVCGHPHRIFQLDEQVIFGPDTVVTAEVYLEALSDDVKFGFDGYIGEPLGKTVNKTTAIDP